MKKYLIKQESNSEYLFNKLMGIFSSIGDNLHKTLDESKIWKLSQSLLADKRKQILDKGSFLISQGKFNSFYKNLFIQQNIPQLTQLFSSNQKMKTQTNNNISKKTQITLVVKGKNDYYFISNEKNRIFKSKQAIEKIESFLMSHQNIFQKMIKDKNLERKTLRDNAINQALLYLKDNENKIFNNDQNVVNKINYEKLKNILFLFDPEDELFNQIYSKQMFSTQFYDTKNYYFDCYVMFGIAIIYYKTHSDLFKSGTNSAEIGTQFVDRKNVQIYDQKRILNDLLDNIYRIYHNNKHGVATFQECINYYVKKNYMNINQSDNIYKRVLKKYIQSKIKQKNVQNKKYILILLILKGIEDVNKYNKYLLAANYLFNNDIDKNWKQYQEFKNKTDDEIKKKLNQ